jgi:hypothetical protein
MRAKTLEDAMPAMPAMPAMRQHSSTSPSCILSYQDQPHCILIAEFGWPLASVSNTSPKDGLGVFAPHAAAASCFALGQV